MNGQPRFPISTGTDPVYFRSVFAFWVAHRFGYRVVYSLYVFDETLAQESSGTVVAVVVESVVEAG